MKRIGLVVAYDGTNYCGWQTQPNGITVQGVLNDTLSELLGEKIETIGASRTDAGVHAMGNVAVFDTNTRIPGEKISYALNQRLPEDIRIQLSEEVEPDFHPRYCDSEKTYEYRILNRKFPVPTERLYTYFYHYKLDVDMKTATFTGHIRTGQFRFRGKSRCARETSYCLIFPEKKCATVSLTRFVPCWIREKLIMSSGI